MFIRDADIKTDRCGGTCSQGVDGGGVDSKRVAAIGIHRECAKGAGSGCAHCQTVSQHRAVIDIAARQVSGDRCNDINRCRIGNSLRYNCLDCRPIIGS